MVKLKSERLNWSIVHLNKRVTAKFVCLEERMCTFGLFNHGLMTILSARQLAKIWLKFKATLIRTSWNWIGPDTLFTPDHFRRWSRVYGSPKHSKVYSSHDVRVNIATVGKCAAFGELGPKFDSLCHHILGLNSFKYPWKGSLEESGVGKSTHR